MLTRELSSLQHPIVKHLVTLSRERSYRSSQQHVLVSGIKLLSELAKTRSFKTVLVEMGYSVPFSYEAESLFFVTSEIMKKITGMQHPEPIAAEIAIPPNAILNRTDRIVILDGISDPGNLGTLLRSALALRWEGVFITPGSVDPFNDKALRAAKGATFILPIQQGSWDDLKELLERKGLSLLAADAKGEPLNRQQTSLPIALALGSESHGLSPLIKERARLIAIPMDEAMESLNVSAAGAILMYELL
jgi:TrmH family RNA methyltransferase